jgi:hypothetical protein
MKTLLACVTLLMLISGCNKSETALISPDNMELAQSKSDLLKVVNEILVMNNDDNLATEIQKIDYYETKNRMLALVTYRTIKGATTNIGIEKEFDNTGNLVKQLGFKCKGTCNCQVGASLNPDGTLNYAECTCSPCSMTVTVYNKSGGSTSNRTSSGIDIQSIANRSHAETFNSFENVAITDLRYEDNEKAAIQIYTYSNSKGQVSTFMILKAKVNFEANGQTFLKEKSYEVDCTGSCDCRERFIPANNAIECTCSPCKMKITEVPN